MSQIGCYKSEKTVNWALNAISGTKKEKQQNIYLLLAYTSIT